MGFFQNGFENRVIEVGDFAAMLALDVGGDHAGAEGAGAIERQKGGEVGEAVGRELPDHLRHAFAFKLEDAEGVAVA